MSTEIEMMPPCDLNAEAAVIGCMLLEVDAIAAVAPLLAPGDFFRPANRIVFAAIMELYRQRQPAGDLVILTNWLQAHGQLDEIGGWLYLSTLMESAPTAAGVQHYARLVKDKSIRREIIRRSEENTAEAYDSSLPLDELLEIVESRICDLHGGIVSEGGLRLIGDVAREEHKALGRTAETGIPPGLVTGWRAVNEIIRPMRPGQLIIVAGRPGMGKSAMLLNLALFWAASGKHGVLFSLEMENGQLSNRAVQGKAQYTQEDLDNIATHEF